MPLEEEPQKASQAIALSSARAAFTHDGVLLSIHDQEILHLQLLLFKLQLQMSLDALKLRI